jgi:N-acetylneuraminic acid mutarotase
MIGQNAPPIEYTQPITVGSSETIVAIAAASGFASSSPALATYTVPATATPSFSLAPGAYTSGQTVSISDGTPNALIYFTLDGTTPSTSSPLYQTPISVASSETIQAVAVATGYTQSAIATAVYTIWPAADVNEWAWMSGPTVPTRPAWGSLGVPSINNFPGGRGLPAHWTDAAGNLWMFGGYGYDAHDNNAYLNDLWKFTPSTIEWTWMGGDSAAPYGNYSGQPGVYGTQGTPASSNLPGGRQGAASWIDSKGSFWLYGGNGYDSADTYSDLNDLWMYKESSNQWTWVGGSQTTSNCFPFNGYTFCAGISGAYGTLGQAAPGNTPGARDEASTWVDSSGNLWLFGGHGVDPNGPTDYFFNDLWKYSTSTNEWTWIAGSNTDKGASCVFNPNSDFITYCGQAGTYGTLGTTSASNNPGGRSGASTWIDGNGNLWLFGGMGFDATGNFNPMNDLWEFTPSTSRWTWIGGNNTILPCIADWNDTCTAGALPVVYGTEGTPSAGNMPEYTANAATWTDKSGNFWLYSGSYTSSTYTVGLTTTSQSGWNDLWEYSPSANEWTWMNGTEVTASSGPSAGAILGTQGVPAPGNSPGSVFGVPAWTDAGGNLWMFDGLVWRFQPSAPAAVPSFALSPSPASISVAAGSSGSFAVSTSVGGGFNSAVTLSASGQPSGVTVQFNPTSIGGAGSSQVAVSVGAGVATGSYTITVTGGSGTVEETATISLTVTAYLPPPSFTVSGTAVSVTPGATTGNTSTITLAPSGAFTGNVALTASVTSSPTGAQYPPTLSFGSTSPVNISSTTAGTATLTLTTTAATRSALSYPKRPGVPWYATGGAALACLLLFGLPARRRNWRTMLGILMLLVAITGSVMACGGGGNGGGGGIAGTTAGAYTITVTGTSSSITETGTVTLTVQ